MNKFENEEEDELIFESDIFLNGNLLEFIFL